MGHLWFPRHRCVEDCGQRVGDDDVHAGGDLIGRCSPFLECGRSPTGAVYGGGWNGRAAEVAKEGGPVAAVFRYGLDPLSFPSKTAAAAAI